MRWDTQTLLPFEGPPPTSFQPGKLFLACLAGHHSKRACVYVCGIRKKQQTRQEEAKCETATLLLVERWPLASLENHSTQLPLAPKTWKPRRVQSLDDHKRTAQPPGTTCWTSALVPVEARESEQGNCERHRLPENYTFAVKLTLIKGCVLSVQHSHLRCCAPKM